LFVHPYDGRIELGRHRRQAVFPAYPVAPADIDFVFENQRYRHGRERFLEIAFECHDALHAALHAGREDGHPLACADTPAIDASGESAKVEVGADYVLHHETQWSVGVPRWSLDRFHQLQQ